jgi:CelD/BcsL family acetyltransferase involved in cellulose biosynthesis
MDVPIDLVMPPLIAHFLRFAGSEIPCLRYQRTLFVGSPCSDEGTVGLLSGVALADVAPILHDAIRIRARQAGASMIVWKDFPDTVSAVLESLCTSRRLFKLVSYPGTRLPLPGDGFDAYLQSLTSSHRHNLRKKLRRSKEVGDLQVTVLQHPDPSLLDEIFPLYLQSYLKGKSSSNA